MLREGRGLRVGRVCPVEVRAGHREPHGLRGVRRDTHIVAELAALALAVRGVVATRRSRRRAGAGGRADDVPLRTPVGPRLLSRLTADRGEIRAHHGGPVVGQGVRRRRGSLLAEDEVIAFDGHAVFQVVGRLGRVRLAPRIRAHQFGVGVHLEGEALIRAPRRELQADEHGAPAVGHEVRALDRQPLAAREVHLHVAVAAREPGGRSDPLAVYPEPEAVEELDRGTPQAAHLPSGMKPHGREAPRLRADDVCPVARGHVAAVVEPVRGRERRRVRDTLGRRGYGYR